MRRFKFTGIILAVTGFGLALRLSNLSPYLVYPDSYTSLVVADVIDRTGTIVAHLGAGGLIYPDFFGWTRPGYPLLIAALHALGLPLVASGRGVALMAGVACIPAAAWLAYEVTHRRGAAVVAAVLMSLSYASVVWSGFVLTETTGNLALLGLLAVAWHWRRHPPEIFDPRDYLTGLLLAVAILTRYEYALLAPIILLIAGPRLSPSVRWVNITAAAGLMLALAVVVLRPFDPDPTYALSQLHAFLPLAGVGLVAGAGLLAASRFVRLSPHRARTVSLACFAVILAIAVAWAPHAYPGLIDFARQDGLIVGLGSFGLILMLYRHRSRSSAWLIIAAIIALAAVYFRVNPTMARYGTHLLPLVIIPASVFVLVVWDLRRRTLRAAALIVIFALALFQGYQSFGGLKSDQGGIWQQRGYEQTAARLAAPAIPADAVVFAALPEPYYLASGGSRSVQSFTTQAPWLYAPGLEASTPVVVVVDQSLKDVFPEVYQRLQAAPVGSVITTFEVGEPFRYRTQITLKPIPVILYKTTLGALQSALK